MVAEAECMYYCQRCRCQHQVEDPSGRELCVSCRVEIKNGGRVLVSRITKDVPQKVINRRYSREIKLLCLLHCRALRSRFRNLHQYIEWAERYTETKLHGGAAPAWPARAEHE